VAVAGGAPLGTTPLDLTIDCGAYELVLALVDHEPRRQRVVVVHGGEHRLIEALPALSPPCCIVHPPQPRPSDPPPGRGAQAAVLSLAGSGYAVTSGITTVLSLGILGGQYAVEVNDKLAIDWGILASEATLTLPAGDHRLRVLIRSILHRVPQVLHDTTLTLPPGARTEVRANLLRFTLTVNGKTVPFDGPAMRQH
jgi:hypothetical protein